MWSSVAVFCGPPDHVSTVPSLEHPPRVLYISCAACDNKAHPAEVLLKLKSMNLKLALATSSVSALILPFLKRHDIEKYFDAIVTGEMVKNGKPHPDIYLLAAEKVGVDARNAIVVEDALAGLQAGRSAGAVTIAIPDARWLDPKLYEGEADYIVGNLSEVLPLVRSLLPDRS
ncbi:HAD family hydrolase [bacterium]|nr:MAG: HAD family hydrolase [bacterium]